MDATGKFSVTFQFIFDNRLGLIPRPRSVPKLDSKRRASAALQMDLAKGCITVSGNLARNHRLRGKFRFSRAGGRTLRADVARQALKEHIATR
jgi:hypothetical protein